MKKQSQVDEKTRKSVEPISYAARRGHPRKNPIVAAADAAASRAMIQMARIGAEALHRNEMSRWQEQGNQRSGPEPKKMSDALLAESLEIGSGARAVQKLASGDHQMSRRFSAKAVEQIIKSGLLPRRAVRPVARDAGHARLMEPFQPFLEQLLAMGAGATPDEAFSHDLKCYVIRYRVAAKDLAALESAERKRFQAVRTAVANALLRLRCVDYTTPDDEIRERSRQAAFRIAKLLATLSGLKSLFFEIEPAPRSIAAQWAGTVLPATDASGGPDFEPIFASIYECSDKEFGDLDTALALHRELLCCAGPSTVDDDLAAPPLLKSAGCNLLSLNSPGEVEALQYCIDQENLDIFEHWDDGEVDAIEDDIAQVSLDFSDDCGDGEIGDGTEVERCYVPPSVGTLCPDSGGHVPASVQRYVRHLRRSVGDVGVKKLLLLSMLERWHGAEEEKPDTVQSDFEDRLFAICAWVSCEFPGSKKLAFEKILESVGRPIGRRQVCNKPSSADLKLLLRDLFRSGVRQVVELNADIPLVVPAVQY